MDSRQWLCSAVLLQRRPHRALTTGRVHDGRLRIAERGNAPRAYGWLSARFDGSAGTHRSRLRRSRSAPAAAVDASRNCRRHAGTACSGGEMSGRPSRRPTPTQRAPPGGPAATAKRGGKDRVAETEVAKPGQADITEVRFRSRILKDPPTPCGADGPRCSGRAGWLVSCQIRRSTSWKARWFVPSGTPRFADRGPPNRATGSS